MKIKPDCPVTGCEKSAFNLGVCKVHEFDLHYADCANCSNYALHVFDHCLCCSYKAGKKQRKQLRWRVRKESDLKALIATADRVAELEQELLGYRELGTLESVTYYYDLGRIASDAEALNLPDRDVSSGPLE